MKEPTNTTLVLNYLIESNDYITAREVMQQLRLSSNRTTAALHHLYKYRAVDFIEVKGRLWWFATPQTDARSRRVDLRRLEEKPRTRRIKKKLPSAGGVVL